MSRLLQRLWADDCGAVLTTEYLTLGSIVALGSASGLTTIKDSINDECKDFGQAVHEVNQAHRDKALGVDPKHRASRVVAEDDYQFQTPIDMTP